MKNMLNMPQKTRFGEQTPPAIFPPIFGLLGLGLAWRHAVPVFQAPSAVAELILGAVTLLFAFAVFAYLRKVVRRPGVVIDDFRVLPGRAGLAAMVLSFYLTAAVLQPLHHVLARGGIVIGLAANLGLMVLMVRALILGPPEQRDVTPVWHLIFVGPIIAPLSAISLGWLALSEAIFFSSLCFALLIWGASLAQFARRDPPPPLRPLLAIHLAPASLLGTVAFMLGKEQIALALAGWAGVILVALLLRARYVTMAGFSPLWGAFTFPLAAFSSLMLLLAGTGAGGEPVRVAGGVALVAGTLIIPAIAVKVMQAWAKNKLGPKTNAARA